jgi:ribosomal-protein-alanine N-acetyltransferase
LERADIKAIYDIFSDPEVTRFWGAEAFTDMDQASDFIRRVQEGFEDGSLLEWGVVWKENDALIGTIAYSSWSPKHRRAEFGIALHRNYWGRGVATELLPDFLDYGFNQLNLHRIEADVDPENKAVIHLLEKFGFEREGQLRERNRFRGNYRDSVIYGLLK